MATLIEREQYRLSSHVKECDSKTLIFVKLTDSALKSIEAYVNDKSMSVLKPAIQFHSNSGIFRLPNSDVQKKSYSFTLSTVETDGLQGSFECLQQAGSKSLESLGCMLLKMHINANEDSYEKTRVKMEAVEKENKKFCAKEIKPSGPYVGRKVKVKRPINSNPAMLQIHKAAHKSSLNHSVLSGNHLGLSRKPSESLKQNSKAKHAPEDENGSFLSDQSAASFGGKQGCPEARNRSISGPALNSEEDANCVSTEKRSGEFRIFTSRQSNKKQRISHRREERAVVDESQNSVVGCLTEKGSAANESIKGKCPSSDNLDACNGIYDSRSKASTFDLTVDSSDVQECSSSVPMSKKHNLMNLPGADQNSSISRTENTLEEAQNRNCGLRTSISKDSCIVVNSRDDTCGNSLLSADVCCDEELDFSEKERHEKEVNGLEPYVNSSPSDSSSESQDLNYEAMNDESSVSSSLDAQEYLKSYVTITSREQRAKYKADFNAEYEEYRILHDVVKNAASKFAAFESKLSACKQGSAEYYQIKRQIYQEYMDSTNNEAYQAAKRKLDFLHGKLSHIKKLVMDYDQAHGNS